MKSKYLLRLYPRAWRERYGSELLALLEASPVTLRTLIDVSAAAFRERWIVHPAVAQTGLMIAMPAAIALAIASLSGFLAQLIWTHYGASPSFQSHIVGDIQKICYPPAITAWPLQISWLSWAVLFRPIAAGINTDLMERWKVRPIEIPLWATSLLLTAVVRTTVGLAENCGYTRTPAALFEDAFLSSATPLMMLFLSSTFVLRWQRERRAQKAPLPTDFTRLGLS